MMTKGEFLGLYGRAVADIGRMRRHEDMRQRCQACEHRAYLDGCYCEQKGCNCRKRRAEIYRGSASR